MKKKEQQKGQVLLITIMLLATALTVVLSSSFKSTQETQTNKLEEEAQKALSVAEAGIESALQSGSSVDLGEITTGFSGQAKIDQTTSSTFTTPLLQKDEQYTFYLSDYKTIESNNPTPTPTPYNGNITISLVEPDPDTYCYNDNTKLAIELTFVNTDGTISKRLINGCGIVSGTTTNKWDLETSYTSPASHLLFLRVIAPDSSFQGAKIKISRPSGNWQLQGNTIVSEAQSTTGVTKTVQLFQSYPQIPSEFFVTSF